MNIQITDYFYCDNDTADDYIHRYFREGGRLKLVIKAFKSIKLDKNDLSIVTMERFRQALGLKESRNSEKGMQLLNKKLSLLGCRATLISCLDRGYLELAKMIHKEGISIDFVTKTEGFSPLHYSVDKNYIEMTKWLISEKASLNIQTKEKKWTPLHYACQKGFKKQICLLLEAGADPNVKIQGGQTSLHIACNANSLRLAYMLLRFGADPSLENDRKLKAKDLLKTSDYTPPYFPKDVWKIIIENVPEDDLFKARRVSRQWNSFLTGMLIGEFARKSVKNPVNPPSN